MKCNVNIVCNDEGRKAVLEANTPPRNGIQAVEIVHKLDSDPLVQRVLAVFFFGAVPSNLDNAHLDRFSISGGVRVPGSSIRIQDATSVAGHLELTLDRRGDFSDYVLTIQHPDLDPLYSCRKFNFKVECPNPFDCQRPEAPPPPLPPDPPIDYQTKDYRSFRRALLDFLPTRVPGFDETNEGDLAITLAELFAYAGDQLSYYQDAVANEAYLETARQPLSVKRHARLVDYRMHSGLAARAVIQAQVNSPTTFPKGHPVTTNDSDPNRRVVFETDEAVQCDPEQNVIAPYTWQNKSCCLPGGSTYADLTGKLTSLVEGQLLVFEEVLGPVTMPDGSVVLSPEAADPTRRQIVRVNKITFLVDSLPPASPKDVTRVTWQDVDALQFGFCLEQDSLGNPATVIRGNLVRAGHGKTVLSEAVDLNTLTLKEGPLSWLYPPADEPTTWLFPPDVPDPRGARSSIQLTVNGQPWQERESLLDSGANDPDFVVDTDPEGRGILRFGDGELGKELPASPTLVATYRVGNGSEGNVAADALTRLDGPVPGVDLVRNPLPAVGGTDPQPIVDVQRDAPQEFLTVQYRAVTADDYARAAEGVPGVSSAAATFRWTGSWLTVFVAVDPVGRLGLPDSLREAVVQRLESYRQAGYDLEIRPPEYVPLEIELEVCVLPDYFQADVEEAVLDVLSSGLRLDGTKGFFHPDNFTFGQSLYLSRLYAAVQSVEGVRAVHALVFKRLNRPDYGELAAGVLTVGPFEIVRLDDNPSEPDNGTLKLDMEGGK